MDKQDLIEKYQQIYEVSNNTDFGLDPFSRGEDAGSSRCSFEIVEDLKKLDEPQKVKVPAFVDEWIEMNKAGDVPIMFILKYFGEWFEMSENKELNDETCEWVIRNPEKFMRAWLDGYEVKEEPKYLVLFPCDKRKTGHQFSYLMKDGRQCYCSDLETIPELTESTIKSIDERYWPFAVPVEKV